MIIDLPSTTTQQINNKLVEIRAEGGVTTLGRVLTLVIVTDDGGRTEEAVEAANDASREHPCRVLVVARGAKRAAPRLDAQIRVGGDAGASEVIVLRLYGPLADEGASCVIPLLLPDAPVVAWWPFEAPPVPAQDPIGQLAGRRITDAANDRNPIRALDHRKNTYVEGDTDLAWTRLTTWRAMLAAALDLPPHERVTAASVAGEADSPSTDLLAAWLASRLRIPVTRLKANSGGGIVSVSLERRSGAVELVRPDEKVGTLTQPGQPPRRVALQRRSVRDCLAEELRRLDADEIYAETLKSLNKVVRGRAATAKAPAGGRSGGTAKASTASTSNEDGAGAASAKASGDATPAGKAAPRSTASTRSGAGKGKSGSDGAGPDAASDGSSNGKASRTSAKVSAAKKTGKSASRKPTAKAGAKS